MEEKKLWFKAKNYGWGWYPASREGWFVMAWYIAALIIIFRKADSTLSSDGGMVFPIVIPFILVTTILILICYKTGEKPEWRWGEKKNLS